MAQSPLLDRLDGLDARFEEIGTLITAPNVIADQQRYVKLTKEYKSLETLLAATRRYRTTVVQSVSTAPAYLLRSQCGRAAG